MTTTQLDSLLKTMKFHGLEPVSVTGNMVKVQPTFEIEVESSGIYKLLDDGYVVAPFDNADELCRFIKAC